MLARLLFLAVFASLLGCGSTDAPAPTSAEPEGTPSREGAGEGEGGQVGLGHGGGAGEEPGDDEPSEAEHGDEEQGTAAVAPDTSAHEVVIVVVHDDPLLRSETRLLEVIAERMQMRRIDAIQREATDEEATFARAIFAGESGEAAALPSTLSEVGTSVFVRFPPNRELGNGALATRGFGGALAFRRGEREPYLELAIDDEAAWRGPDEQLWPWLISLVRAEGAS